MGLSRLARSAPFTAAAAGVLALAGGAAGLAACAALVGFPDVPDEISAGDGGGAHHDGDPNGTHDARADAVRDARGDSRHDAVDHAEAQPPDAPVLDSSHPIDSGHDAGSCQHAADGGGCIVPPSCQGTTRYGLSDCGSQNDDDCCATLLVPGGQYSRTFTSGPTGPGSEMNTAFVSAFRLDKYPVTVGRFAQYVTFRDEGGQNPALGSGKHTHLNGGSGLANIDQGTPEGGSMYEAGWQIGWSLPALLPSSIIGWNKLLECAAPENSWQVPSAQDNLPINCVGWTEAYAFCIWDGGFLPSETEWEYAAVGGANELQYPWGMTPPGTTNSYAIFSDQFHGPSPDAAAGTTNLAPVGYAPLGVAQWGQLDLVGEVSQWTVDAYAPSYPAGACIDCAAAPPDPSLARQRVVRGSGFQVALASAQARNAGAPESQAPAYGFRCARTPE